LWQVSFSSPLRSAGIAASKRQDLVGAHARIGALTEDLEGQASPCALESVREMGWILQAWGRFAEASRLERRRVTEFGEQMAVPFDEGSESR
jgi:hypothetical protein